MSDTPSIKPEQERTWEEAQEWIFDTGSAISIINHLLEMREFEKPDPLPRFTGTELTLLTEYLFRKPEGWEVKPWPLLPEEAKNERKKYDQILDTVVRREFGLKTQNPEERLFTAQDIVRMGILFISDREFWAQRELPLFSEEDTVLLLRALFFKPKNITLRYAKRTREHPEMTMRQKKFVKHYLGDVFGNGAKAARMAGYSPRSAKQIAYRLIHGR